MRFNFRLLFKLTYLALFKAKDTHGHLTPHRRKALFWWYLLIPPHIFMGWIGLMLDEIFFRAYRKQEVKEPLFIIGNFRSGSTLTQRLLAKDKVHMTAMHTWEIYLAPSITQRKVYKGLMYLDQKLLGGGLLRILDKYESKWLHSIPMHRVGLREVDEDEGVLIHNYSSSFLMFIYPFMEEMEPYLYFDKRVSERDKRTSMEFYYRIVQRHIYYTGGKQYIAKNPAFSGKINTLREYFPDAKFIYLVRNPVDMLASKTSFFTYIWRYFNDPLEPYPFRDMLLDVTQHWYDDALEELEHLPESEYIILKYKNLVEELDASIRKIYDHFSIPLTTEFERTLAQVVQEASGFVSKHKYSLIEMGYSPKQVYNQYQNIFERFHFDLNGKALMAKVSKQFAEID